MASNFNTETLMLMTLTYITLIIIILRIALSLFQYMTDSEIDRATLVRKRCLPLQEVVIMKTNQRSNRKPNRTRSSSSSRNSTRHSQRLESGGKTKTRDIAVYDQHQMISHNSSSENKNSQSDTERDDSFWLQSFRDSEQSPDYPTIPNTSAYGMRKIGKKTYIDDTNIGSPLSKALEQKSYEEEKKSSAEALKRKTERGTNESSTRSNDSAGSVIRRTT